MPSPQFAPINPSVLQWARTEGGWRLEDIAQGIHVKLERVQDWETGERQPTMRQVQHLAKFLHRPLGVFFLPEPPRIPPLATEYRRLPGIEAGAESPQLRLALRQMINRRERALDLLLELGHPLPQPLPPAQIIQGPQAAGSRLREFLAVSLQEQLAWPNEWQAWRAWRNAAEASGVLVFQFHKVPLAEARGTSILDTPMPAVGINAKEQAPEAKSFTLMHELVHLMLAAGHEEQPAIAEHRSAQEWEDVERFAERAASYTLVPEEALAKAIDGKPQRFHLDAVRRLARRFRITTLAMATRLRESGYMTWEQYHAWRAEWADYVAHLPEKKSAGFATPAEKAVGRSGRAFTQLVLDALGANRITSTDAARFLDLKFDHFDQLPSVLAGPGSGTYADE